MPEAKGPLLNLYWLVLLSITGTAALMSGCRTASSQLPPSGQHQDYSTITQRNTVMADALANYSIGVLREGLRDTGAVSNYLRAVELQPELTSLSLRVAIQYIRRGENDKAVAVMEEASRHNPKSMGAVFLLSQIYQIINRPDEARMAARKAIELEPKNNKGYLQLAALMITGKDEAGAVQVLRQGVEKVSDPLPILRLLGDLHAQRIQSLAKKPQDLNEAIRYYELAVKYPTDDLSMAYLQKLGDLYIINRQVDKALACFQKVALYDPDDYQILQKMALCHVALGNKDQALGLLKKIARHDPQSPDIYYYLGELYDSLGDKEHAIENFRAARDAEPSNPKSYLRLAVIYLRDNPQQAREVIQDGLKHLPKERLFLEILVNFYLRNHQYTEALALFDQMYSTLLPNDPILSDPRFYVNYGIAAQQCQLGDKAIDLYWKALEIDPSLLDTRVRLAILLVWRKDREEAFALMEEAVAAVPNNCIPWFYYAIVSSRAEDYRQAVSAFQIAENIAKKLPDSGARILDTSFYFNYGAASERSGDYITAEKLFEKSINLDPENSDAYNYIAYMWAEKGINLDMALDYVNHALEIEPDNAAYLDTLGWIYFKKGQYDQALEFIREAHVMMPDDPTILDHLGDTLAGLKREKSAIEAWKQSFQADSSNLSVEKKLRDRSVDVDQLRIDTRPNVIPPPAVDE
jgi:tetratricopeptide (TPR) repeat protein